MKIKPAFKVSNGFKSPQLSEPATYANELYRGGFKMLIALREASKLYGVEIHTIASELGIRGGKKRRSKIDGYKNQTKL